MFVVIMTGTPGTGKTTLAKKIASSFEFAYIDGKTIIRQRGLADGYDLYRKAFIVDTKKLSAALQDRISLYEKQGRSGVIIDSHLSQWLPKPVVDMCIVTTCNLKTLKHRLEKRKYSKQKIRENLDAEIFEICKTEALELGHAIVTIDTTRPVLFKSVEGKIRCLWKNRQLKKAEVNPRRIRRNQ